LKIKQLTQVKVIMTKIQRIMNSARSIVILMITLNMGPNCLVIFILSKNLTQMFRAVRARIQVKGYEVGHSTFGLFCHSEKSPSVNPKVFFLNGYLKTSSS